MIWHDLECGLYREDLPLWQELAASGAGGPVLEIGAGTGRVSLELAREGHAVTAIERDPVLLAALAERAAGTGVEVVGADARAFALGRHDFALVLVPMQTIQLMGGPSGRLAFLRAVRNHLRRDGVLACALVEHIDTFDTASEAIELEPELARHGELTYSSRPVRVSAAERTIRIEIERRVQAPAPDEKHRPPVRVVIDLDRLTVGRLQQEAVRAGLRPLQVRTIASTELHTASMVVVLGG